MRNLLHTLAGLVELDRIKLRMLHANVLVTEMIRLNG